MNTLQTGSFRIAPHRITTTFLKLDLWSPGAGFIAFISTKGIKQIKKRKLKENSFISFIHTKIFNSFFRRWVQFRVVQFHVSTLQTTLRH